MKEDIKREDLFVRVGEIEPASWIIEGIALNVPVGLGEPVFGNFDGELSKALFAIPAVKGVAFGAGFAVAGFYQTPDGAVVEFVTYKDGPSPWSSASA